MKKGKAGHYIKGLGYYATGRVLAHFMYDKKYLKGRWFEGDLGGRCAVGWRWVTWDGIARLLLHTNHLVRFPVAPGCIVGGYENIEFDPDDLNNFQVNGSYFQGNGKIIIGRGTYIGPNVGLITANHDLYDPGKHSEPESIILGKDCWIGMNSVIMPGVKLGSNTVVGAGSIVTKSFEKGHCVIAGNPAHLIKELGEQPEKKRSK